MAYGVAVAAAGPPGARQVRRLPSEVRTVRQELTGPHRQEARYFV